MALGITLFESYILGLDLFSTENKPIMVCVTASADVFFAVSYVSFGSMSYF